MSPYCTLHLHNVPAGREAEYAAWFDGPHRKALASLRGLVNADRFEVSPIQIMPDIPQPWRYMSLYEFDLPNAAIDLPALGPLLADARAAGLVADEDESERIYSYRMYSDWKISPNWQRDQPLRTEESRGGKACVRKS